jgi:hypothetical protein
LPQDSLNLIVLVCIAYHVLSDMVQICCHQCTPLVIVSIIHTYRSRLIPEGVAEASDIPLRRPRYTKITSQWELLQTWQVVSLSPSVNQSHGFDMGSQTTTYITTSVIHIIHTYIPLTLYPRRSNRGISDIPPRHPCFTNIN